MGKTKAEPFEDRFSVAGRRNTCRRFIANFSDFTPKHGDNYRHFFSRKITPIKNMQVVAR